MSSLFRISLEPWSSWVNSTRTSDDGLDFLMNTFIKFQTLYPHLNKQSDLLTLALSQPQTSWVVSLHTVDDVWVESERGFLPAPFGSPQGSTAAGIPLAAIGSADGLPASGPGNSDIMLTFNGPDDWPGPSVSLMQDLNATAKFGPSNGMDSGPSSGLLEPLDDIFSPRPFRKIRTVGLPPSPTDLGTKILADGTVGSYIVGLAFAELADGNDSMEVLTGDIGRVYGPYRPDSSKNILKYAQAVDTEPSSYEISVLLDFQEVRDQGRESSLLSKLTQDIEEELIQETIFGLLLELEPASVTLGVLQYRMILFNHLISDLEYPAIYSAILSMGFKGQDVHFDSEMIAPIQVFTMQMLEWEKYKQSRQGLAPKFQGPHDLEEEGKGKGKGKEKTIF